jgi:hypothetical protein
LRFACLLVVGVTGSARRLPAPANVALAGAPKIAGCSIGAALHESPLVHC